MTDDNALSAVFLAALNAAFAAEAATFPDFADVVAYEKDDVPGTGNNGGTKPADCVTISVERIRLDSDRYGGAEMIPGYFLHVGYRGSNVYSARAMQRVSRAALENRLFGTSKEYGPVKFNAVTQPIDEDADYGQYGVDTFSLTA
jgi:hypothetical protein